MNKKRKGGEEETSKSQKQNYWRASRNITRNRDKQRRERRGEGMGRKQEKHVQRERRG